MAKLLKIYNYLKATRLLKYVIGLAAILLPFFKWLEGKIKFRQAVKLINSSDRDENIGEVDENGYKQLPASRGNASDVKPTGVETKEKLHIEIHGTASSTHEERIQDTQNLLNELDKFNGSQL